MLRLILLRLWRERRKMAILLLSMCLVNAFLALGPLYVQAIAAAGFEQRANNTLEYRFSIETRNHEPYDETLEASIFETMGHYISEVRTYAVQPGFQTCGISIAPEFNEDGS